MKRATWCWTVAVVVQGLKVAHQALLATLKVELVLLNRLRTAVAAAG
jgi:hypothetical protein